MSPVRLHEPRERRFFLVLNLIGWFLAASVVLAPWPAVADDSETGSGEVKNVQLVTDDGVRLHASFYPGAEGKESIPVLLLHEYGGNRKDFHLLAEYLQQSGCAVMVPDLRGHGDSTVARPRAARADIPLDHAKFVRGDFERMVSQDLETVKTYLMARNNAGELNIRKLCVIGSEMGAVIGAYWARADWSWPDLGNVPQGRDVRALVLLSPPNSFKGIPLRDAMRHPALQSQLSMLIVVGEKERAEANAAKQLYNSLIGHRPRLPEDAEERREKQDLFLAELNTRLQGMKLLDNDQLNTEALITAFIDRRLARQDFPWSARGN